MKTTLFYSPFSLGGPIKNVNAQVVLVLAMCATASGGYWIDDLHIEMPDHVYVQIPGCSPVGVESESWGGVKALFR